MQGRLIGYKLGGGKGQVKRGKGRKRAFALDTSSGLAADSDPRWMCYLFPQECAEGRMMGVRCGRAAAR